MLGIYYGIAICLPTEIDAFLFSGPEQFFYGAPMFSPLPSTMIFFDANSIDFIASIARGAQKCSDLLLPPSLLFFLSIFFLLSSLPSFSYPRDKFESALETREKTCRNVF